jgi:hypothetical protein
VATHHFDPSTNSSAKTGGGTQKKIDSNLFNIYRSNAGVSGSKKQQNKMMLIN